MKTYVRAGVGVLVLVVGSACGGDDPASKGAVVAAVAPVNASQISRPSVTPEQFRRNNPMDWVGRSHREGIVSFVNDMGKRKGKKANLCAQIIQAAVRVAHESGPEVDVPTLVRLAKKGATSTFLCRPKTAEIKPTTFQSSAGSPEYLSLADAVLAHIENAEDLNDLASRLNGVLVSASTELADPNELTAIQSMAAIGFDSYDYNLTNPPPIEQFGGEYGDCLSGEAAAGGDNVDACTGGRDGASEVMLRGPVLNRAPYRLASLSFYGQNSHCVWMEEHFHMSKGALTYAKNVAKRVAGADVLGAFGGFMAGAFFGPAIGHAMLAGATAASAGAFGEIGYHGFMCMMSVK